jgi:hypothetical protein
MQGNLIGCSNFLTFVSASRGCADLGDPTEVFRIIVTIMPNYCFNSHSMVMLGSVVWFTFLWIYADDYQDIHRNPVPTGHNEHSG